MSRDVRVRWRAERAGCPEAHGRRGRWRVVEVGCPACHVVRGRGWWVVGAADCPEDEVEVAHAQ